MSLFKFETRHDGDWREMFVTDSGAQPGALLVMCSADTEGAGIVLPREQVEKLVKVLNDWLGPQKQFEHRRSH